MNIIFFSNGIFSLNTIIELISSNHYLQAIVTNKDKKSGRGQNLKESVLAKFAKDNNIPVFKVSNFNNRNFINSLVKLKPELFITISYRILPDYIHSLPKYGSINIHTSILPDYRGAAPIQRSLMDGKEYLGLSSFYLNDKIDGGDIINNKKIMINNKITYGEAYELLSKKSATFTLETINKIKKGFTGIKQENNKTTYAKKISKNEYLINLDNDSKIVHDKIRALTPPGCFIYFNKRKVKLLNTFFVTETLPVGTFIFKDNKLIIGCKKGSLEVANIQFEGKKVIDSNDFSNMNFNKNLTFSSVL